ncbi:MAG: hypothetical protein PHU61_00515 [Candidatus Absconditabacteria bacterium]|nr:hypothetical protein [Candidatus Absconditabacteria bacterium]MDD3868546.1 hypothetical protein [Candidatus Absconditabacteria bacterium]MDD4714110.1 hypothetical protein [Candidatus Absconditabacteria bacterium]
MKQVVLGLLIMALGSALMYFSYPLMEMFGRIPWAEKNLGGTRNAFLFGGFLFVVIGGLILFGVIPTTSPMDTVPTGIVG